MTEDIRHDENCKCWENPKFKTCISCKFKNMVEDSNGMEHEPNCLETWQTNNCEHDYQPDMTCGVDITACAKCGDVI